MAFPPTPVCLLTPPDRFNAERHARHSSDGPLAQGGPNAAGTQTVSAATGHRPTKNLSTVALTIELGTNPTDTSKYMWTDVRRTSARRTEKKKNTSTACAQRAPAGPPRSSASLQVSKVSGAGPTGFYFGNMRGLVIWAGPTIATKVAGERGVGDLDENRTNTEDCCCWVPAVISDRGSAVVAAVSAGRVLECAPPACQLCRRRGIQRTRPQQQPRCGSRGAISATSPSDRGR